MSLEIEPAIFIPSSTSSTIDLFMTKSTTYSCLTRSGEFTASQSQFGMKQGPYLRGEPFWPFESSDETTDKAFLNFEEVGRPSPSSQWPAPSFRVCNPDSRFGVSDRLQSQRNRRRLRGKSHDGFPPIFWEKALSVRSLRGLNFLRQKLQAATSSSISSA